MTSTIRAATTLRLRGRRLLFFGAATAAGASRGAAARRPAVALVPARAVTRTARRRGLRLLHGSAGARVTARTRRAAAAVRPDLASSSA